MARHCWHVYGPVRIVNSSPYVTVVDIR